MYGEIAMFLRLARLRFVIIRVGIYSFLILLFLQILAFYKHSTSPSADQVENRNHIEEIKPVNQYADFDQRRIERIKSVDEQNPSDRHNWTGILLDHYMKKLAVLNRRDAQNDWKVRLQGTRTQQDIFEIYEETMVGKISFDFSRENFRFGFFSGFSTTEILFIDSNLPPAMSV